MVAIEIILIIVGIICVIVSLVMNFDNKEDNTGSDIPSELSEEQKNKIKQQIDKMIDEQISGVAEKTEASLDKISNTKILEMNEYAESVLGEINRNHNETVFLYDMLNEKAKEIKTTVKDVNNTKRQVEKIHAEVKNSEENAVCEPDRTDDGKEPAYEQAEHSDKNTKDIAKERLAALVKKSNERARTEDGTPRRNVQAEKLENKTTAKTMTDKTTTAKTTADKTMTDKTATAKKTETKQPAKKTTKQTTKQSAGKAQDTEKNTDAADIQLDPGLTNNEKILKLDSMGASVKDIAKQLNLGVGEVKLVIDLYKGGN